MAKVETTEDGEPSQKCSQPKSSFSGRSTNRIVSQQAVNLIELIKFVTMVVNIIS